MTKQELVDDIHRLGGHLGISSPMISRALAKATTVEALRELRGKWKAEQAERLAEAAEEKDTRAWKARQADHRSTVADITAARRQRQTLGQRWDLALQDIRRMEEARAGSWEPRIAGGESGHKILCDPKAPKPEALVDVAPLERAVRINVEMAELLRDAVYGQADPADLQRLPGYMKDSIIRSLVGVYSADIAAQMPWLGARRTIENVRAAAGLRPVDGTEREQRAA